MTKRMLIDATHAEETRVVVLDGNRLEDFDVETSTKKQLKGNIYLAKVVRVEPSLQAAFVEYGGNRHGFLAFSEIHPDYYQIPVADRQALLDMQAEEARREEEEEDRAALAAETAGTDADSRADAHAQPDESEWDMPDEPETAQADDASGDVLETAARQTDAEPPAPIQGEGAAAEPGDVVPDSAPDTIESAAAPTPIAAQPARIDMESVSGAAEDGAPATDEPMRVAAATALSEAPIEPEIVATLIEPPSHADASNGESSEDARDTDEEASFADGEVIPPSPPPETFGGETDTGEESRERRAPPRFLRNYKIQEVIRRRQILLVQVVKEERGTKGAALTTYISLAGRYCVLMPNSPRGGGISRKITSATDRRRLKEVMAELDIPDGMGLIVRTAGANRPKPEIKRDCEYLLRLWDDIRDHTMKSVAPALIYEEASLIKRTIRDVYARDIDEIMVDGEEGWKAARDFMRMLMPTHVKKVQLWRDPQPLFARQQVEAQLDAMLSPTVQLRSGGYLVINQTEALVAIDVNSGRATRERGIEETALRTNTEAADEVARQLRLRDLAGLIVIDFIDMESRKNNATVERRLKEALKNDRARIQVGHISHFGLMEMSRQRLRPSLAETSFVVCPHCGGTGHVRGTESAAIHVLRDIEEEGAKRRAAEIMVRVATPVAMYILNHKRARLSEIETHYAMAVAFTGDDTLIPPQIRIERIRAQTAEAPVAVTADARPDLEPAVYDEAEDIEAESPAGDEVTESATAETTEESERRGRRRRRRRGGRRDEAGATEPRSEATPPVAVADADADAEAPPSEADSHVEGVPEHADGPPAPAGADDEARGRRRGRRGGRRRRRDSDGVLQPLAEPGAEQPDLPPIYSGPTPADPFGGQAFDIFDVLERAAEAVDVPMTMPAEPVPSPSIAMSHVETTAMENTAFATVVPSEPSPSEPVHDTVLEGDPERVQGAPSESGPDASESSQPIAANDPAPEPLIKPIVIGATDEPPAERKRGWWRR